MTTSPMRGAVIAAITVGAARMPAGGRLLAVELAALPYDRRTDDDLFTLAERFGVTAARLADLAALDATQVAEEPTAICDLCKDTGSIIGAGGRYTRCHVCNPDQSEEDR